MKERRTFGRPLADVVPARPAAAGPREIDDFPDERIVIVSTGSERDHTIVREDQAFKIPGLRVHA